MKAKLKSGAKRVTYHKQQMPTLTPSSQMARETRHPLKAEAATAQEPSPRGNKRSLSKRTRKHRLSVRNLGEKGRTSAGSGTRKCLGRSPGSPKLSIADTFSPTAATPDLAMLQFGQWLHNPLTIAGCACPHAVAKECSLASWHTVAGQSGILTRVPF